ncbi:MAG: hypothetical protein J5545_03905 [Bacteroidaceae bacterium]|nr:hypothetical protein [Bacteroidaceae bacterium]
MKTNILHLKHLFALLLSTLTFVACSSDNNELTTPADPDTSAADSVRFTAIFGVKNPETRALTDPGDGTLTASWQVNEQISIVYGGEKYIATVTAVDGAGSATVTATLPGDIPNNQAVTFIYPSSAADGSGLRSDLLANQDGTLATLSSRFDVSTAEGKIVRDGHTAQPNGTVTLKNQFAICKFQFKDEHDKLISTITKVTITDLSTTEVITVRTHSPQSAVYVAMKPSKNSMKFEVDNCIGIYQKTSNANLEAGLFYQPTLTTSYSRISPRTIPLTFEAKESVRVTFNNQGQSINLQYSLNGGELTDCSAGVTLDLDEPGEKVSFYGDNTSFSKSGIDNMFTLAGSGYIYGNIMSLLESSTFATATELKADAVFFQLFRDQTALYSHPTNELVLPATTLTSQCYYNMFLSCRNLTKAPDLPATTLAQQCYFSMFSHCINLTKAPDLPATTLADQCYARMFDGCTNLTKAPDLPATTLANLCYIRMFNGCTSLNSIKCLATDIPLTACTSGWLDGVAATGTFTKAASMTSWPTGVSGIPEGWTVVNE